MILRGTVINIDVNSFRIRDKEGRVWQVYYRIEDRQYNTGDKLIVYCDNEYNLERFEHDIQQ